MSVSARFVNLNDVTRRLREVGAAGERVFREAARSGGAVVQRHAIANAPGPHIGLEVITESPTRAVVAIGPLKEKWFYRFRESGTKEHGPRHKKTRFQSYLKKSGSTLSDSRKSMMRWYSGGKPIFARRVRGVAKKPFMQPAIERVDDISTAVGKVYLDAIMEVTG